MIEQHGHDWLDIHPLSSRLTQEDRAFLVACRDRHRLSFQQVRALVECAIDLSLWQEGPLSRYWHERDGEGREGKRETKEIVGGLFGRIDAMRRDPARYDDFQVNPPDRSRTIHIQSLGDERLLGRCPCPVSGEKTRCCNLMTLDAVRQCGFACSYCSIQSFYHGDGILFAPDLHERLQTMVLPEGTWHIGTGQSSDSLMWGNAHGVLDAIAAFARTHPEVVVELKTKSARTDWIGNPVFPGNVVATWSLNAPTIASKEEHGAASVEHRLEAALRASEAGVPIGFHLHPMVHFSGWEAEYAAVIERVTRLFDPARVVMISLGTLTFTKEVLRQLRMSGRQSRVLRMELTETAGKFSYPTDVKQRLFSHAYRCFPDSWKQDTGPFFYLCMEDPRLWEPVFDRSYPDNASFEQDMRRHYLRSLHLPVDKTALPLR